MTGAWWADYTLRVVALGAALLGAVGGGLGCLAVLRRQSLLGDALSHAALPGVVLAYLIAGSKAPLVLMLGAAVTGGLAVGLMTAVLRTTTLRADAALGLSLSVFFGLGVVLLTWVQARGDASQAGLDRYLFGQAATLTAGDVRSMAVVAGVALLLVLAFWKELKLLCFDPGYAASLGWPMLALDLLCGALLVLAVTVGLQAVGVVLMSAILVAPAVAARQWTDKLGVMMVLAALFGAAAGVGGAVLSSRIERLPTGPTMVLVAAVVVAASLLGAPRRGVLARARREARQRREFAGAAP